MGASGFGPVPLSYIRVVRAEPAEDQAARLAAGCWNAAETTLRERITMYRFGWSKLRQEWERFWALLAFCVVGPAVLCGGTLVMLVQLALWPRWFLLRLGITRDEE